MYWTTYVDQDFHRLILCLQIWTLSIIWGITDTFLKEKDIQDPVNGSTSMHLQIALIGLSGYE